MSKTTAQKKLFWASKRAFDLAAVVVTAPITIPVGVIVAGLVRIFLGSPVLFRQERIGKDERPFHVLKFRTMLPRTKAHETDEEELARQTKFGLALRKTSLDEIPQLINVARGEMSLIGPRPLLPEYLTVYTEKERLRHSVRPGITGEAQVSGRNQLGWDERLALDVDYATNPSVRREASILVRTVTVTLRREGILPEGAGWTERLDTYRNRIAAEDPEPSIDDNSLN